MGLVAAAWMGFHLYLLTCQDLHLGLLGCQLSYKSVAKFKGKTQFIVKIKQTESK